MDHNDRQAIEGLFDKLAHVERQAAPRDTDAEHFISGQIARQPGAPYFMAQTIVMQDHALNAAQARIEELEYQAQASRQGAGQGGFLSRMFGGGAAAPSPQMSQRMAPGMGARPQGYGGMPAQQGQGGGFLAGAAQTAMGVAGGVLLGNAVMGMFAGEAEAAPAPEEEEDDPGAFEDAGGWDEEI
ncbi:DUF2076 domain-containing protein [Paracoccus sp. CPCC 101403]|uniref:DUF2076 domain-containing protein n=2 Tax=Paracoccus broussonetiae TaxID=3075834 RepID=A0ABU3EAZ3_9RHOB|nr:DUF2076 domain-containing protein [Paracoccus sp. CPCC 101403]MDT1061389.1 DUF2076 domain-containing protein [Paracoccus sp. CPCC 101403]